MNNLIWDLEISMYMPFLQLVYWPDEDEDEFFEKESFRILREELNIFIDVKTIVSELINENRNNVSFKPYLVYKEKMNSPNCIILGTTIDPRDQMDTISIFVTVQADRADAVRRLAYEFYVDDNQYNMQYHEGCNSISERLAVTSSEIKKFLIDEVGVIGNKKFEYFISPCR